MGEATGITWTDHTFSPWWGCTRVSSACDFCYAEATANRWGQHVWGADAPRRIIGDHTWNDPLRWDAKAAADGVRRRVFCASMADVFEEHDGPMVDAKGRVVEGRSIEGERARLWQLIELTPHLDWLLLTKRPQNVLRMVPSSWTYSDPIFELGLEQPVEVISHWPANVGVGTTAETQRWLDVRMRWLVEIPAPMRFVSYEPGLEPLDLSRYLGVEWMDALGMPEYPRSFRGEGGWGAEMFFTMLGRRPEIDWVIAGGESGPHARRFDPAWALDIVDQCFGAGVAPFVKQLGTVWSREHDHGATHGDDMTLWPEYLRVRQFPEWKPRLAARFEVSNDG